MRIEYLQGSEATEFDVHSGLCGWDDPEDRVHQAVNAGRDAYEGVVTLLRVGPDGEPQPLVASGGPATLASSCRA